MDTLKKIITIILIILFPLGILYCMIHTIAKDFPSFLGGIFLVGAGIVLGIYIVKPEIVLGWWGYIVGLLPF